MLVDGMDAAPAAFRVGYGSATQFNREYSCFFAHPATKIFGRSARQALRPWSWSIIENAVASVCTR